MYIMTDILNNVLGNGAEKDSGVERALAKLEAGTKFEEIRPKLPEGKHRVLFQKVVINLKNTYEGVLRPRLEIHVTKDGLDYMVNVSIEEREYPEGSGNWLLNPALTAAVTSLANQLKIKPMPFSMKVCETFNKSSLIGKKIIIYSNKSKKDGKLIHSMEQWVDKTPVADEADEEETDI